MQSKSENNLSFDSRFGAGSLPRLLGQQLQQYQLLDTSEVNVFTASSLSLCQFSLSEKVEFGPKSIDSHVVMARSPGFFKDASLKLTESGTEYKGV